MDGSDDDGAWAPSWDYVGLRRWEKMIGCALQDARQIARAPPDDGGKVRGARLTPYPPAAGRKSRKGQRTDRQREPRASKPTYHR